MPATKRKLNTKAVFTLYWQYTKKHPWLFWSSVAGLLILQAGNIAGPLFIGKIFDLLAQTPTPEALQQTTTLIGFFAAVSLIGWVGGRMEMGLGYALIAQVAAELTKDAFAKVMRHSHHFFSGTFTGALTRQVTRFSSAYEHLYYSLLTVVFGSGLYIVGITVVILFHNLVLGLMVAGWVAFYVSMQLFLSRWQQPLRLAKSREDSAATATLADAISNQNTVTLFSANSHEEGIVGAATDRLRNATQKIWNLDAFVIGIQGLLSVGITVATLWLSVRYWQQGQLTIGTIFIIQAYIFAVLSRIFALGRQFRVIYSSLADATEMVELLEKKFDVEDKRGAKDLVVTEGEVWFDDVSFRFGDGKQVLHQLNFRIAPGEKVALVGPSGAGKSTVTKLLLRLYDVDSGNILIDKQNIADVTQDSVRDAIAFVPQEPILFHRTLMENIRYGRRDATDEEVIAAAKAAHCHEFIDALPQKYETFVGERGIKLSGGERQRVAIARAILKDAPILVLDEATSSLDSESEAYIQDALETLMEGKTVITVAHRLSTIMKMDRIVVMQGGAIVAMGTHLELIREQGLYQKLWSIQAGGFLGDGEKPKEAEEEIIVPLADTEEDQ